MIPDWLQLLLAVVGLFLGIAVGWYFFREQQKTDFNRLERALGTSLTEIAASIARLHETLSIGEKIDLARDLSAMRTSVEELRDDVRHLTQRILEDVRRRQVNLMESVDEQFRQRVDDSKAVVVEALERDLTALVAPELRVRALQTLQELYLHAMRSVGEYQRQSIDQEFQRSLRQLEESLRGEVGQVAARVDQLRERFDALPLGLPPASEGADAA
jgi:hypothetical protein